MRIPEWSLEAPEEGWKFLPALFGLPVEYEETYFQRIPWITKTLTFVLMAIFLYHLRSLGSLLQQFGFTPSEPWRHGSLTLISYFFLHGNVWHLLLNIYFLYNFGDNVEDYLGKKRYLFMLFALILSGSLGHMVSDLQSKNLLIGSNYALSGLIVFYVLRFPYARMGVLLFVSRFRWFQLPAFEALIGWGVFQLILNRLGLYGFKDMSIFGHLASVAMGCVFSLIWRKR
jgi:membrane associated rhomboid family serine protease